MAIARAAGWGSKLIIMDEPTAALGVQETAHVHDIIRTLQRRGVAVLLVSHNMKQVMELSDRVYVFRRGRISAELQDCRDNDRRDHRLYHGCEGMSRLGRPPPPRSNLDASNAPDREAKTGNHRHDPKNKARGGHGCELRGRSSYQDRAWPAWPKSSATATPRSAASPPSSMGSTVDTYRLSDAEIADCLNGISRQEREDIEFAQDQVRNFAQAQRDSLRTSRSRPCLV